ncbi:hypothetical protein ACLKA7_016337 [Drosophila subpalustris]
MSPSKQRPSQWRGDLARSMSKSKSIWFPRQLQIKSHYDPLAASATNPASATQSTTHFTDCDVKKKCLRLSFLGMEPTYHMSQYRVGAEKIALRCHEITL